MAESNSRDTEPAADVKAPPERAAQWRAYDAARAVRERRLWAAVVFVACTSVLVIAGRLTPDPSGVGTHRQLGFGECGMLVTTGLPCPTCGMTTAFSNTVRGRLIQAFLAQPAGLILAIATMAAVLLSGWTVLFGRMPRIAMWLPGPYLFCLILLFLLLGGWAFKLAQTLLTTT